MRLTQVRWARSDLLLRSASSLFRFNAHLSHSLRAFESLGAPHAIDQDPINPVQNCNPVCLVHIGFGVPQKIRKNNRIIGKVPPKPNFFSNFIFHIFWGIRNLHFSYFSYFRLEAQNGVCTRQKGSQLQNDPLI